MNKEEKVQKTDNHVGTMMICYAIIALICVIVGVASLFLLTGIVIIFGVLLALYGILLLFKLGN